MKTTAYYDSIPLEWITVEPLHAVQLLPQLTKPTIIKHPAVKPTAKPRWIVTLQHANESTGLSLGVDLWKKLTQEGKQLDYDLYFLIANGYAAMPQVEYPVFGRRFAPDQTDFNRCWYADWNTAQRVISPTQKQQIDELTAIILGSDPQYIIDVHNTTGRNKPLGFIPEGKDETLVRALVNHVVYMNNLLGSLRSRFEDVCDTVTLECGKTGTIEAYKAGQEMVDTFLDFKNNGKERKKQSSSYKEIGRMVIKDSIDFCFHPKHLPTPDDQKFWIRQDLEDINQNNALKFGPLGSYQGPDFPVVFLQDGKDLTTTYLAKQGSDIFVTKPVYGLLFSTNASNVKVSELGYLAEKL